MSFAAGPDSRRHSFAAQGGDFAGIKAAQFGQNLLAMLPDIRTGPSNGPRGFGNVRHDAAVKDRSERGILDLAHHSSKKILGIGSRICGGIDFRIGNIRLVEKNLEYPSWSRPFWLPIAPFTQQGVCQNDDATHDGGNCDLFRFPRIDELLIFSAQIVIEANGDQRWHVDCSPK